jgi:AcrR family transcriptional regulator
MQKSLNPSSIRSRQMMQDALLSLMQKKPYDKITITEITEEADLVRKTFYRHYRRKEDILNEYINELFEEYIDMLLKQREINNFLVKQIYFEFWQNHFEFALLLKKNNLLINILKMYDIYIPKINKMFPCKDSTHYDEITIRYQNAFASGAFWKTLCLWIEEGGRIPPREMAKRFTLMLSPNAM